MVIRAVLCLLLIYSVEAVKLPGDVIASKYNINLETDIGQGFYNYTGSVKIDVEVLVKTDCIVLHMNDLTAQKIELYNPAGLILRRDLIAHTTNGITCIAMFPQLNAGAYRLEIQFDGFIRNDSLGFFARKFKDDIGSDAWIAATNFHSTYARFAFPCFDEPRFMASFALEIKHGKNYFALSSSEPLNVSETIDSKFVITSFKETIPMPTYAFGFAILPVRLSIPDLKTSHRVFATPPNNAFSALTEGDRIITIFEFLFQKPKVQKLDQIIIPDFEDPPYGFQPCGIMLANEKHIVDNFATDKEEQKIEMMLSFARKYAVSEVITVDANLHQFFMTNDVFTVAVLRLLGSVERLDIFVDRKRARDSVQLPNFAHAAADRWDPRLVRFRCCW